MIWYCVLRTDGTISRWQGFMFGVLGVYVISWACVLIYTNARCSIISRTRCDLQDLIPRLCELVGPHRDLYFKFLAEL